MGKPSHNMLDMMSRHTTSVIVLISMIALVNTVALYPEKVRGGRQLRSPWTEDVAPLRQPAWRPPQLEDSSTEVSATYRAVTFGRGHVITFDGKHYNIPDHLSPACPHILFRDSVGFSFTVLRRGDSISLYTMHTVITLHSNNKVEVNNTGNYRELPIQSWDNSVSITHNNRVVMIQTRLGITIQCDLHHKECLYLLQGNYYNHTNGLLGTNDNDASNDFQLQSGTMADSSQEFINYFELSGSSTCRPAPSSGHHCVSELTSRCQHLFEDDSSVLAPCHRVVNPHPYLMACTHDVQVCRHKYKKTRVCDAARAYVKMCHAHGVLVPPPSECGRCGHNKIGTTWMVHTLQKLDVVMVTSLHAGVLPGDSNLGDVVYNTFHTFEAYLRQQAGIQNVRVGLLGYGGSGYLDQPHVYTVQGESLTRHYSSAIWRDAVSSLEAGGVLGAYTGPVQAIRTALNFTYREEAVKLVLLLTDQADKVQDVESLKEMIGSQGILLNVFTTSRPGPHSYPIQGTHITRDLAELVRAAHGSVFDIDLLVSADTTGLHRARQDILQQIRRNLYQCHQCTCQSSTHGEPTSVCQRNVCT